MANKDNLLKGNPATQFTSGQRAVECGRKGGKISQQRAKDRKTLADIMTRFSNSEIKNEQLKAEMAAMGFESKELQNKTAVGLGLWKKAIMGDINAYREYMQLIGEQQKEENINVNVTHNPLEKLSDEELLNHLNKLEGNDNDGTDDKQEPGN